MVGVAKQNFNMMMTKYHPLLVSTLGHWFSFPGAGEGVHKHFFHRDVSPRVNKNSIMNYSRFKPEKGATENSCL